MSTDLTQTPDLLEAIRTGNVPETESAEDIALSIVQQILGAQTEEEVFDAGGSTAAKDLVGQVLYLRAVKLMKGELADARMPVYVLLDCEGEDGKGIVVNTGAARIMAQAWRARELGLLPKHVRVVEVGSARPGENAPLGLAVV